MNQPSLLRHLAGAARQTLMNRCILHAYFKSGWAFLIPYLVAYLLYAWLGWPVNPQHSQGITPLCLLNVYWALHTLHVVLGIAALRSWWLTYKVNRLPSTFIWSLAPWLCLAMLFWIPGINLEWPSDPWEHLRRINEWHIVSDVTNHSSWKKSSYFLPYSLTGHTTGLTQLYWLDLYYTGICLLLSWQYYRLASTVGLGERMSFLFVLLNALTFGNSAFSFHRYYGLSSSIIAQIAAVALTRLVVEYFSCKRPIGGDTKSQPAESADLSNFRRLSATPCSLLRLGRATLVLLPLIAFNHIQGLGIAGLGVLAVIVWRLIEWKRSMIGWLVLVVIALCAATILWLPRNPILEQVYRPQGWLTAWYGFNLFSPSSPAFDRCMQILGIFGVLNLILALWLVVRRNDFVGWLTLMPVLALALPCVALPFANIVATSLSTEDIIIFHRMLFAVPVGFTLVAVLPGSPPARAPRINQVPAMNPSLGLRIRNAYPLLCIGLASAVVFSPGRSAYNRFWQSTQTASEDLQLRHLVKLWRPEDGIQAGSADTLTISHPLVSEIKSVFRPDAYRNLSRLADASVPIRELTQQIDLFVGVSSNFDRPSTHQNIPWRDRLLFHKRESYRPAARLVATPTSTTVPWITLGGAAPQQLLSAPHQLSIRNPIGSVSYPFCPELIPVSRYRHYQLTCEIRQSGAPGATNYLAVAWYDKNANLLTSNLPVPRGAGSPAGWNNGTFSYFGLVGGPAAADWTRYSVAFGLGEPAMIPANAAFLRVGAMLNFNGKAEAGAELTNVRLVEHNIQRELLVSAPSFRHLYTPASPAAKLAGHWSPQYVPLAYVGTTEMRAFFGAEHH